MANNRIGIKCLVCGELFPIAKTYGSGYALSNVFTEEKLQEFFSEHAFCDKGTGPIGTEGDFALDYEFAMQPFEENDVYKCAGCGTEIVGWMDEIDGRHKYNYCRTCGLKQEWGGIPGWE